MDPQIQALYCVLGELYFKSMVMERKYSDEIEQLKSQFDSQLASKNAIILSLQKNNDGSGKV